MWSIQPGSALDQPRRHKDEDGDGDAYAYAASVASDDGASAASDASGPPAAPYSASTLAEMRAAAVGAGEAGEEAEAADVDEETRAPRSRPTPARYFSAATAATPGSAAAMRKVQHACFLCGSFEHRAYDCPHEACIACLKPGHRSRDCPTGGRVCV